MNRTISVLIRTAAVLAAILAVAACSPEVVEEQFEPSDSHRDYREALERLDLDETALGRAWIAAARRAFAEPVVVETPFEERSLLDPDDPGVLAYEFEVERGRAVLVTIETEIDRYFADLFRVGEDAGAGADRSAANGSADDPTADQALPPEGFTLIASRPEEAGEIRFEPRHDGTYLLRVQPELLRGGAFTVRIVANASLAFPVQGADAGDIRSFYGDGRDAGTRKHEGVDVFAPRGVNAVAATDALVARVGVRDRGGNIVTLYDEERDLMLYYAHLETQLVAEGERVSRGDPVGTIGNTGNAITTPPHLHIGLYQGSRRRDVDPWNYFVDPPLTEPPEIEHDELLGRWVRSTVDSDLVARVNAPFAAERWVNHNPLLRERGAGENMAESVGRETESSDSLAPGVRRGEPVRVGADAPLRVVGATGDRVRVRTVNGREGFLRLDRLATDPVALRADRAFTVRDLSSGDEFTEVPAGSSVLSWGRDGGREVVELPSGRIGYAEL